MISALMIYGSRARGDYTNDSDIDLLGIGNIGEHSIISKSGMNLSIYGINSIIEMCRNGELFAWHLHDEGKLLYDRSGDLTNALKQFKRKDTYSKQLESALGLLKRVIEKPSNSTTWNIKNIVWSVKTTLLADMANKSEVVFSEKQIAEKYGHLKVEIVFKNKRLSSYLDETISICRALINNYTETGYTPDETDSNTMIIRFTKRSHGEY